MRDTVRLWSLQNEERWHTFQQSGVLRGDGRRVDGYHRPAYRWLLQQMRRRIAGYRGGYPIWAWYESKPDLRYAGYRSPERRKVCLELEVPSERVLVFDFETWHCVLNRWHLCQSRKEEREWEARGSPESELSSSWERVFDLAWLKRSRGWGKGEVLQAVVERVYLSEVRSARLYGG